MNANRSTVRSQALEERLGRTCDRSRQILAETAGIRARSRALRAESARARTRSSARRLETHGRMAAARRLYHRLLELRRSALETRAKLREPLWRLVPPLPRLKVVRPRTDVVAMSTARSNAGVALREWLATNTSAPGAPSVDLAVVRPMPRSAAPPPPADLRPHAIQTEAVSPGRVAA